MSVTTRRLRQCAAAALVAGLALGTAACSKKEDDPGKSGTTTVTLQIFGTPGLDKAAEAFNASHTDIKIDVQPQGELKDFAPKLAQWLATGSGAGDIVMLEEGQIQQYLQQPKDFANLLDLGAKDLESTFLPYKWKGGFSSDQSKLVGLGTDVGGLAMCYRTDLFTAAFGAENATREKVSAFWADGGWDAYAAKGKEFVAKNPKAKWIDSATSIVQPYVMQNSDTWFYDRSNKFIGDTNPVVKKAWDYGLQLATDGLTSKLARWSPDWDNAFKQSAFATVPCPAWMTGVISGRAGPEAKGKWDVATIPGKTGNWGGSYLAIPKQSKHQKQAFEALKYLTGQPGAIAAYKAAGPMPSSVPALDDPAFKDSKNEYFNNAPTGQIFGASVRTLKPIYLGPKHQSLWEDVFEPQMRAAEQGKSTSDAGWKKAVEDGKKLANG